MEEVSIYLPFDPTGTASSNLIEKEEVQIYSMGQRLGMLKWGTFFVKSLKLWTETAEGVRTYLLPSQFTIGGMDVDLTDYLEQEVCNVFLVSDSGLPYKLFARYQAVGGPERPNVEKTLEEYARATASAGQVDYATLNHPVEYVPKAHTHHVSTVLIDSTLLDCLKRIADAIGIDKSNEHLEIFNSINFKESSFHTLMSSRSSFREAQITAITDEVNRRLAFINAGISKTKELTAQVLKRTREQVAYLNQREINYANALYCCTGIELARYRKTISPTPVVTPFFLTDLELFLDFTNEKTCIPVGTGLSVRDQSPKGREFFSPVAKYEINPYVRANSVELTGGYLGLSKGEDVILGEEYTLICVCSRDERYNPEKLTVLRGPESRVDLDVDHRIGMELKETKTGWVDWVNYTNNADNLPVHVNVVAVNSALGGYARCNYGENLNQAENGLVHTAKLEAKSHRFNSIGDPQTTQSGRLLMILAYSRRLSLYEMDLVMQYVQQKCGVRVYENANPDFDARLSQFETEYELDPRGVKDNSIASLRKETLKYLTDPKQKGWITPNVQVINSYVSKNGNLLVVNAAANPDKNFWKATLKLVPGTSYLLESALYFKADAAPDLVVLMNGKRISPEYSIKAGETNKVLMYAFKANSSTVVLELRCLNSSSFGCDYIRVMREADAEIFHYPKS